MLRKSYRLWDNVEKYSGDGGTKMTSQYGAYALRAGLEKLHAHAHAPMYSRSRMHTQTNK
jgi:hypothetical protein